MFARVTTDRTEHSINSSLELFEGLGRPEINRLGTYFTVLDVKAGRNLGRRGTLCQHFGVVLSGQVAMSFDDSPVGIIPAGCFFGAVALLNPNGDYRRRGAATALGASRLAIASPRDFAGLLYMFPLIAQRIYGVVDQRRAFVVGAGQETIETSELTRQREFPMHIPV